MLNRVLKYGAAVLVILVPVLLHSIWTQYTAMPDEVVIATGPAGGQWHKISQSMKHHVEQTTGMQVRPIAEHTSGALHHLDLLSDRQVDFALYMRGSQRFEPQTALVNSPQFVCNLYSDVTLLLIRRDLHESGRLRTLADLEPRDVSEVPVRLAVGQQQMGEYRLSLTLLSYYYGNDWPRLQWLEAVQYSYAEIEAGFADGSLDAALISAGHQAPIFKRLLEHEPGLCKLGEIPEVDAIIMRNVALERATIPRGLFRYGSESLPAEPMDTVALHTSLLTHEEVPAQVVESVLLAITSDEFVIENQLLELAQEGHEAARRSPEFPVHAGALSVYDPHLKPLVDPDVIESTENLRSFAVSLLIAGFFAYRWWRNRRDRLKDHRLDEFISSLLEIDRSQPAATEGTEVAKLQKTLDRVIALRNKALREFSAKDFDEDSAADSFLSLCDTVASGLNARILQQQFADGMRELSTGLETLRER